MLAETWDNPNNIYKESVTSAIRKMVPKIRFAIVASPDLRGHFDENLFPKDLQRYSGWFPMILLIPGPIWDKAMANLGPKNPIKLEGGIKVFNGEITKRDGIITLVQKNDYNFLEPSEYGRWIKKAAEDPEFKRIQSGKDSLSSIITPYNPINEGIKFESEEKNLEDGHDTCPSLKMISWPDRERGW
jgi:hypothetical protein